MEWCFIYIGFSVLISLFRFVWFCFDKDGRRGYIPAALCMISLVAGLFTPVAIFFAYGMESAAIILGLCSVGLFISLFSLGISLIYWRKIHLCNKKDKK